MNYALEGDMTEEMQMQIYQIVKGYGICELNTKYTGPDTTDRLLPKATVTLIRAFELPKEDFEELQA